MLSGELSSSFFGGSGVQVESSTPAQAVSPSAPVYMPGDMLFGISTIQATVTVLNEADRSSLTALRSKRFLDGKAALDSVNSSLDALDALELTISGLRHELRKRRAHFIPLVNTARNAARPVMRLLPDVLPLIIEAVACVWRTNEQGLGWITATHVCVAWRNIAFSLPSLWARELGAFLSPEGFHEILSRARDAPLTLHNDSEEEQSDLPEHYWHTLSQPNKFLALDLKLNHNDVARLANFLHQRSSIDVESLSVVAYDDCSDITYPAMVSLPNLRWLSLEDVYIPFHAPNILGLSLRAGIELSTSISCAGFLDVLEQCQNLLTLDLSGWAPTGVPRPRRKVQLPRLQTLMVTRLDSSDIHYFDLCQCLDLPALRYVALDDCPDSALSTMSVVFHWLHINKQTPPCIKGVSDISINAKVWGGQVDWVDICLDDGSVKSTKARLSIPYLASGNKAGVHIRCKRDNFHQAAAYDSAFFSSLVAGCLNFWGYSTVLPVIQSAHFDFQNTLIDWHSVLRHLVNTEVLHATHHEILRLLPAISKTDSNNTMLLPRLKTIVFTDADLLAHQFQSDSIAKAQIPEIISIHDMLSARAVRGMPVQRMTALKRGGKNAEDVNAFFAELVSLYV